MSRKNGIFIAATGQNVGKTTLCLGMMAVLQKRYANVGFIKPVGQQHVQVEGGINVDKDVILFKEYFQLPADWSDMSPVIVPSGFTKNFLDQAISEDTLLVKIHQSYNRIKSKNTYMVVEGTGHVGVGSIINLNNAKVASELGLDVVIIASGGLGSAHDELALNIAMCKSYGVKVYGVILNRVKDEKREMILEYFPKTLKKWDIPLLGCVPYNEFLNTPSIKDFEPLLGTSLLSGEQHRYRHFKHSRLVAGSLKAYKDEMNENELVITPASREDIILANVHKHREYEKDNQKDYGGGMILTGSHPPSLTALSEIKAIGIPVLYAPMCSYDIMKMITSFIAKIRTEDVAKVQQAIKLVEENVNIDLL